MRNRGITKFEKLENVRRNGRVEGLTTTIEIQCAMVLSGVTANRAYLISLSQVRLFAQPPALSEPTYSQCLFLFAIETFSLVSEAGLGLLIRTVPRVAGGLNRKKRKEKKEGLLVRILGSKTSTIRKDEGLKSGPRGKKKKQEEESWKHVRIVELLIAGPLKFENTTCQGKIAGNLN